jgi:DNA-binding LytR/AlgR family response regulator
MFALTIGVILRDFKSKGIEMSALASPDLWPAAQIPILPTTPSRSSARIAIKVRGRIVFINCSDIVSVHAEGNYVSLQRDGVSYLLREPISQIAEKFEPYGFIRIHRSVLVNTAFVEEIRPHSTGEYFVRVRNGKEFTVTRTYKRNLKSLAEFWIGTGSFFND